MTDTCPVCGKGASDDPIPQDDGSTIGRINDHIPCVLQMQTNAKIAATDAEYWSIEWTKAHVLCDRYRDLFQRANAQKRKWRSMCDQDSDLVFCDGCGASIHTCATPYEGSGWIVDNLGSALCPSCIASLRVEVEEVTDAEPD